MHPTRFPLRFATAILLVGAATACGLSQAQKHAVADFSAASGTLGDLAVNQLSAMRESVVEMNEQGVMLIERNGKYDYPREGPEEAFTPEALEARLAAARALRAYGELLFSLAAGTDDVGLESASAEFAQSVRGLMGSERKLSEDQLGAIASAVSAVGGLIVESKRATAVERIVKDAHPQVAHLASLLADDFDPTKDGKLASQVVLTTERLLIAGDQAASTPAPASQPAAGRAAELRAAGIRAMWLGRENRRRTASITTQLAAAVRQMSKANDELKRSIESGEVSIADLRDFGRRVRGIADLVKAMH